MGTVSSSESRGPVPAADPRVERSRQAILTGATAVFLRQGFDGARIDDIAREAGVAKRTVYNVFADKEELFRATVLSAIGIAESFTTDLERTTARIVDAERDLPRVMRQLAVTVLRGPVLPLRRLLVSEARRFPDLVVEYRQRAPEAVLRSLAGALAKFADEGHLTLTDPNLAAEHLAFLTFGADLDRGMFDPEPPSARRIRARADAGTAVFLRAYRQARLTDQPAQAER